jgi:hypothetical protein
MSCVNTNTHVFAMRETISMFTTNPRSLSPQIWVTFGTIDDSHTPYAIFQGVRTVMLSKPILWPSRYSTQFWCMNWNVLQRKEGQTLSLFKLPPKFWKQLRSNRNKQTRLILVWSRNCLLENSQRRVVLGYVLGDECRGETHVHFLPPSLYLGDIGRLRYVDAILGEKWEHLCLLHRTVITWTDRTWVTTGLQAE